MHSLSWRDYEVLLAEIFKTQGFVVELGPGSNDGGVDITLIQRDPIGDMMTVVQAKKYATHNKIGLTEVQALFGAQVADGASKSLFVTTSKYAPVAKRFAARETVGMSLATSDEVSRWCESATNGIIEDKSSLVSRDAVLKILREIGYGRDARLVHATHGYESTRNSFAIVIKESKHAALLMSLSNSVVSHDGFGQAGFEVPNLDPTLPDHNHNGVVRARRKEEDGRVSYWDGHHWYSQWDGNPARFDLYD